MAVDIKRKLLFLIHAQGRAIEFFKRVRGLKMFYLLKIFFFILTFTYLSEARPQKNPSTAVVVGTVYCDTCFQQDFSKDSHFISGSFQIFFFLTFSLHYHKYFGLRSNFMAFCIQVHLLQWNAKMGLRTRPVFGKK